MKLVEFWLAHLCLICAVVEIGAFAPLLPSRPVFSALASTADDASSSNSGSTNEADDIIQPEGVNPVQTSPPAPVSNPVPTQRRMDPLIASLTRTDNGPTPSKGNPTINSPLGEIQLDKSLYVLLPVVLFVFGGALLSIYVAANSGDALSQAWNVYEASISAPAGTKIVDPDACRGLCSSQEADLQGLSDFMNGLAGKN